MDFWMLRHFNNHDSQLEKNNIDRKSYRQIITIVTDSSLTTNIIMKSKLNQIKYLQNIVRNCTSVVNCQDVRVCCNNSVHSIIYIDVFPFWRSRCQTCLVLGYEKVNINVFPFQNIYKSPNVCPTLLANALCQPSRALVVLGKLFTTRS